MSNHFENDLYGIDEERRQRYMLEDAKDDEAFAAKIAASEAGEAPVVTNTEEQPEGVETPNVSPEAPEEEDEGFTYFLGEVGSAVGGGIRDAAQETIQTASDVVGQDNPAFELPEVNENTSTAGQVARTMVQFTAGFFPAAKALKVAGFAAKGVKGLTKGSKAGKVDDVADVAEDVATKGLSNKDLITKGAGLSAGSSFIAMDPNEERVANSLADLQATDPNFFTETMNYLSYKEGDSPLEGRFKNAIEDLVMGGAFGVGMVTIRGGVRTLTKSGAKAAKDMKEGIDATKPMFEKHGAKNVWDSINARVAELKVKAGEVSDVVIPATKGITKMRRDAGTVSIAPKEGNADEVVTAVFTTPKSKRGMKEVVSSRDYAGAATVLRKGGIRLADIDSVEDLRSVIKAIDEGAAATYNKAYSEAAVTKARTTLAESLGVTPESLVPLYGSDSKSYSKLITMNTTLNAIFHEAKKSADLVLKSPSDAHSVALGKNVMLLNMVRAEIRGIGTSISKDLPSMRAVGDTDEAIAGSLKDMQRKLGGEAASKGQANNIKALSNPAGFKDAVEQSVRVKAKNIVLEIYRNNLLSGPATHVANIVSNSLKQADTFAVMEGAVITGKVRKALGSVEEVVKQEEITAKSFGWIQGLKGAFNPKDGTVYRAVRTGESVTDPYNAGKLDAPLSNTRAISSDNIGVDISLKDAASEDLTAGKVINKLIDGLGTVQRAPQIALVASDEAFKSMSYRSSIYEQAWRNARAKGLDPTSKEFVDDVAESISKPTRAMEDEALTLARNDTFTDELGGLMKSISEWRNADGLPEVKGAVGLVIPFLTTPTNIIKMGIARTPIAQHMLPSVRAEYKAGGRRKDIMLSKTLMTSGLYTAAYLLSGEDGVVVGTSTARGREAGKLDNSIKVGDTYIAIDRLDPVFTPILVAAHFKETVERMSEEDKEDVLMDAMLTSIASTASATWMQSTLDILGVVARGDGGEFKRVLSDMGYNLVPLGAGGSGAHRAISKTLDPNLKKVYEPFDKWSEMIGEELENKVDIYGDPVQHTKTLGGGISPFKTAEASKDPVKMEMDRLQVNPPKLREHVSVSSGGFASSSAKMGIKLSAKQYHRYSSLVGEVKAGGKSLKKQLSLLIESDAFKKIPEDALTPVETGYKAEAILKVFRAYRKLALNTLMQENPELSKAIQGNSKRLAERKAGQSEETKEGFLESIQP